MGVDQGSENRWIKLVRSDTSSASFSSLWLRVRRTYSEALGVARREPWFYLRLGAGPACRFFGFCEGAWG